MKKNICFFLLFCFEISNLFAQTSTQVSSFMIDAPQLATTRKIWIYVPKNYSDSKKKYPVIYMHDAQNLFDSQTSFAGEWNIDETLDAINAPVIIVGIENGGTNRLDELTPFKNQKHGGGKADLYLDFIVKTLKPHIDSTFRTKKNATNTAIFGSSLGGLVSFYAALKYPDVFGKVGCFSPAFWINRKEINDLINQVTVFNAKIYFLCGDAEGDEDMINDLNIIEKSIAVTRSERKKLHTKVIIKDGNHNEKLWREGFKKAYLWLF